MGPRSGVRASLGYVHPQILLLGFAEDGPRCLLPLPPGGWGGVHRHRQWMVSGWSGHPSLRSQS